MIRAVPDDTYKMYPDSDGSSSDSGSDRGDNDDGSISGLDDNDVSSSKARDRNSDDQSGDELQHRPRRRRKLDDGAVSRF